MGSSSYELTIEQKLKLGQIAEAFIHKIEAELADDIGGILDPYEDRKIDNNKLTAMLWYIGDYISAS
jgi:hypothetical protein